MTLRSSDLQSDFDLESIRNSCDVFMVLTIALVPIIARTHTNISIVTLFSLLTPPLYPQAFLATIQVLVSLLLMDSAQAIHMEEQFRGIMDFWR